MINSSTGNIYDGIIPTVDATIADEFGRIMAWADKATNVMGVDGPISRQYSGYEHYFYKNIHGDVIFAFTSNHWRSSEYSYDAYGNGKVSYDYFSANSNPIRYSGQYYDTESGMTYLRARYYDPY